MKIREATLYDSESIAALHAASWKNTYAKVLEKKYLTDHAPLERRALWQQRLSEPRSGQRVFVAVESGQVIGFVCTFIDEHPALGSYLENLHVASQAQGHGIGGKLIREAASICSKQATSRKLYLLVNQDNVRAQRFYLNFGATNAAEAVWNAPDGSAVPTFRFEWPSVIELARKAASLAFERDANPPKLVDTTFLPIGDATWPDPTPEKPTAKAMNTEPFSDAKIVESWRTNALPWTTAVREGQIEIRKSDPIFRTFRLEDIDKHHQDRSP